jgi:TATA-binding protein-associated factor
VPSVLSAIEKIVKNLSYFLCQDPTETPLFDKSLKNKFLSFSASTARTATSVKTTLRDEASSEFKEIASQRTMRSGSVAAFGALSAKFGEELFDSVPKLWESVTQGLLAIYPCDETGTVDVAAGDAMASETPELGQAALDTLATLREMLPTLHSSLRRRFDEKFLKSLTATLGSEFSVIRQAAAKCFAVFCDVETERGMLFAIKNLVRYHHNENQYVRLGGVEFTFRRSLFRLSLFNLRANSLTDCMNIMQAKMLPYVVFFVVPLLGSMSEHNEDCRLAATNAFATIVKMVPLEVRLQYGS